MAHDQDERRETAAPKLVKMMNRMRAKGRMAGTALRAVRWGQATNVPNVMAVQTISAMDAVRAIGVLA